MNSLTKLHLSVLADAGTLCGVDTSKDSETVLARVSHEGDSFLTITLPQFGKDLMRALDQGVVDSSLFAPFKRRKGKVLPEFLGGFLSLVFDPLDGRILSTSDTSDSIDAVRAVLQFTGLSGKLERDCTPSRVSAALSRYISNDESVRDHVTDEKLLLRFRTMSHVLFGRVFSKVSSDIYEENIHPKHGPGAVADKLKGNLKYNQRLSSWPDSLEEVFPQGRYRYTSYLHYLEDLESGDSVPGTEMPVKVITVPKTLKTPRIIAVEPTSMQYMQQGLMASFENAIRFDPIGNIMSWESQIPNQELALRGSLPYGEEYATLDLSDASDMVSNELVRLMAKDFPLMGEALQAVRSEHARVNDRVIALAKYASMGSAMCFPMESIVFTTIVFLGLHDAYPTVPLGRLLRRFQGEVRVYGDDIIVPRRAAQSVVRNLELFGLRVNRTKSFWSGNFRESCGKEYFHGVDVTISRLRKDLPERKARSRQDDQIVSTVALRNHLFLRGYQGTVELLDELLLDVLNGIFPYVQPSSSALGRFHYGGHQTDKWDSALHRPLVKAYVVDARIPSSKIDGFGALVKTLGSRSGLPNPDPRHLERAGRPSALRIKLRYVSPI